MTFRRAAHWGGSIVLGLVLALVCAAVWAFGLGRYGEDYCLTRATGAEGSGFGGPSMSGPVTVRCTYGDTELHTLDVFPLLWTLGCLAALVAGLSLLVVLVQRAGRPSTGAQSRVR